VAAPAPRRGRADREHARGDAADEPQLVIDLRGSDEFAKGHVLGAKNVPLADLERRAAELDRNKARPVIVYGSDPTRAAPAVQVLRKAGFSDVRNLAGGYGAWQQAGLPVEKR
jgi:rhodanese-related sulfurtransferase